MKYFVENLLLAMIWALLQGEFTVGELFVGFLFGLLCIWIARPALGGDRYLRTVAGIFVLALTFAGDLVRANLQLARDVLRRSPRFHPAFIALDIRELGRLQAVLLANLISLTPGTLTIDIDADGSTLYLHSLYARDPEETERKLRQLADRVSRATGRDLWTAGGSP